MARVVVWDDETKRFYGVEESASTLFSFDPAAQAGSQVKEAGAHVYSRIWCATRRDVPYAHSEPYAGPRPQTLLMPQLVRKFDYGGSAGVAASHLMTYDLASGKIEDRGEMRLPDGRPVLGTNAADTGPDGTIYFVGAVGVTEEPSDPGHGGTIQGTPFRLALFLFHPKAG